jgi:hypothetical protein
LYKFILLYLCGAFVPIFDKLAEKGIRESVYVPVFDKLTEKGIREPLYVPIFDNFNENEIRVKQLRYSPK